MSDKLSFSTAQPQPAKNRAASWGEDDRRWFKRRPHRSHLVRPRFPNEWFVQPGDAPDLDMVGVRQVEAGGRRRSPFEIPVSPCPSLCVKPPEAGAHAVFDLTQQREAAVSCAEAEAWISRYARSGSA
jgi:hypothetical protein